MLYKEVIKQSMEKLAKDPKVVFVGYNLKYGSKGYGTLADISKEQIIEMPVAENLIAGMTTGMALEGYNPIMFFERHDFMLIALDAIVNHLDKIKEMSNGQFDPIVIIRAVVGTDKPFDPGIQHLQNFTKTFMEIVKFPVIELKTVKDIVDNYSKEWKTSVMFIEYRGLYEKDFSSQKM